ncbi:MAG: PEP-CTERM sorting domain-containing protein [Planctomycetes bacterium]|nr:PEP-CTERM sorting domain-containing protein [Planctomycetota bacterium]
MKHLALVGLLAVSFLVAGTAQAQIDVVWDGGNGAWDDANWNGGQTAVSLLNYGRGIRIGSGEVGTDVIINNGDVTFAAQILDDFRWTDTTGANTEGTLTITGGASLTVNTAPPGDSDGHWSQFNTKALNIDNGTLRRTFTPTDPAFPGVTVLSGGVFSFAGISGNDNIDTQINITNGGVLENDGILAFGWYQQAYANTKVAMTINNGSLDLTGGNNFDFLGGVAFGDGNPDLLIHRAWIGAAPADEDYSINFTGPGSITVDQSGILVVDQIGAGPLDYDFSTISTLVTYEYLWNEGILRAHGFSGPDGKTFSDFFSTTGTVGVDDYILTSLVLAGDFDADLDVDSADQTLWQTGFGGAYDGGDFLDWQRNYDGTLGPAVAAVPEPSTVLLAMLGGMACMATRRRRRR